MNSTTLILSVLAINIVSAVFFVYDKLAAARSKRRIPERLLHFLELVGGVFSILILMYVIRHKNRKWNYFSVSWLILAAWVSFIFIVIKYQLI